MKILMRLFPVAGLILLILSASQTHAQSSVTPDNNKVKQSSTNSSSPSTMPPTGNSTASGVNPICGITHLVRCLQDLGEDEKGIFTSPLRVHPKDAYWLAPLGAATGMAFAYDPDAAQAVGIDANRSDTANAIAGFGSFYATGAESAGIYFIGLAKKNPKLAETGRLSAEAVLASGTVSLVTKMASNRQRPLQGNGQGHFWADGTSHWQFDSSFPSDHATASMALARVVAGEYPHWYVVLPAYGFAEAIGISRILANQHFPSDVLVGQAIGFLSGGYVLNHRALYRPGAKRALTSELLDSLHPVGDPRTRTVGASIEIPFAR
jgi:membrane-associated phospholipid phosphatase